MICYDCPRWVCLGDPTDRKECIELQNPHIIISITMRPRILLNGRVIHIACARSLIPLVCLSVSGVYSGAAVVFRVDFPGIIP